jgi:hypothetical protein
MPNIGYPLAFLALYHTAVTGRCERAHRGDGDDAGSGAGNGDGDAGNSGNTHDAGSCGGRPGSELASRAPLTKSESAVPNQAQTLGSETLERTSVRQRTRTKRSTS